MGLLVVLVLPAVGVAQNINSIDFENLRASEVSDAQLEQLVQRAEEEGYSIQQVQQLAIARGMNPSEASKLASRARQLRTGRSEADTTGYESQLRRVARDSLLSERQTRPDSTRRSRIFGANLFNQDRISFNPSLNIPTPDSYQLGAGDEVVIDIWGATDQNYQLTVSPEGSVSLPRVGPVYLNGLTMQAARQRLRDALATIYSSLKPNAQGQQRSQVRISLGNIRSINVTVLGEATVPGTYTLPSLATAFNALYVAGGPDSTGTYRTIQLLRGGQVIDTLDVYDYLSTTAPPTPIQLRDQDVLKIGPYDQRIRAGGRFKRTGIFELQQGETVGDLVNYAGGFAERAYRSRITIVRESPRQLRIQDVAYPEEAGFSMQNGDSVFVGAILNRYANRVQIEGAVYRPGAYEVSDTTTVGSLIRRAEGLRGDAFTSRGLIYREQDDLTTRSIGFSPQSVLNNPKRNDIALKRNDLVVINSIFSMRDEFKIRVGGAVQEPGQFPFVYNTTLEDALLQADGLDQSATPYRVEVARRITGSDSTGYVPNTIAETFRFSVDPDLTLDARGRGFELQPYDQIFVRSSPSYVEQRNVNVNGQVVYPGEYALKQQTTRISDVIADAGGLTRFAYAKGASLTRQNEQQIDTSFVNVADTLDEGAQINQQEIKVGIQLDKIMANPGSKYDLLLRDGDKLDIPRELQTVQVAGEVLQPVGIRYQSDLGFKDYIRQAGGATNMGKQKDAYIVYANGSVDRTSRFLFFKNYPEVKPGATIYVPPKPPRDGLSTQETVAILSSVVSTLAIVVNVLR